MEVEHELPLPVLSEASTLMEEAHLRAVSQIMGVLGVAPFRTWLL